MICAIQRLKCVCVRLSVYVRVYGYTHACMHIHIHTFIVYPSACVVARCQIDAVCRCSKPQSARLYRDDPNTRALSSSHYGYVLSAGVFSLWVPGTWCSEKRERERDELVSERWLASRVVYNRSIVTQWHRPPGWQTDRMLRRRTFVKRD